MKIYMHPRAMGFVLISSALLSTAAFATDGKSYPGSQCTQIVKGTPISYLEWSRRLNDSTVAMGFDCPIIDDAISSPILPNVSALWFIDASPTAHVTCSLQARYQTGAAVGGWSISGSYPAAAGNPVTYTSSAPTKMSFIGNLGNVNAASQAAMDFFSCSVPGRAGGAANGAPSSIVSYYAEEQ